MRKMLVILGTIVALLLTVGAAACGGGAQSSSLSPADETPQGILTAAMVAAEDMTSATGDFEVAISFDVDPSQLPDEAQAFVQEPMTVAGTFAYGADPQAADLALALSLMGESMNVGDADGRRVKPGSSSATSGTKRLPSWARCWAHLPRRTPR